MNRHTIWHLVAIIALAGVPLVSVAQSISSEMDQINAGIRARAAAAKGQEPQVLNLRTNGTTGKSAKQVREEQLMQESQRAAAESLAEFHEQIMSTYAAGQARLAQQWSDAQWGLQIRDSMSRGSRGK